MKNTIKQLIDVEKGQALAIVLSLLAIGSLTIAVSVNHAAINLNANKIAREDMEGFYAASAGVEYTLWALQKGTFSSDNETPDSINQMPVSIHTEDLGIYTLSLEGLIQPDPGVHIDWVNLDSSIEPVQGTTSNYTISINRGEEANGNIRLIEFGAVLPLGYTFVTDSPASFPDNLTTDNPDSTGTTTYDAVWVKWLWNPGQGPLITGNHTQGLYIEGAGSTEGSFAWVISQSNDVGTVGEITGNLYKITSAARRPGDNAVTAEIVTDAIIMNGIPYIFSWNISY